jgi:hypothetical protein
MGGDPVVEAAEVVCAEWTELGLPFVVMHGLEGYPKALGRDLDILMHRADAEIGLSHAATTLKDLGWNTLVCPPRLWGRRLVALRENEVGTLDYLELHTIRSLRWAGLRLVDEGEQPTGHVGPFPVSAWATFAKTVVTPMLTGDTARFGPTYLENLSQSGAAKRPIVARLAPLLGRRLGEDLVEAVIAVDVEALRRLSEHARKAALQHMVRHPMATVQVVPALLRQKLGRFVSRTGLSVEISVPAGVAADELLRQIEVEVGRVFPRVTISRSRSFLEKVRQQYRTLSRQGVVLRLSRDQPSDGAPLIVGLMPAFLPRTLDKATPRAQFRPQDAEMAAIEVSRWIIEQWALMFPCRLGEQAGAVQGASGRSPGLTRPG